ncbi:F-BAR domain only protein 1 [Geospiza fortis]|uniref:F-BAR domain only protein 1 n=1 Tax=Geospiza fortis TaxID=48883 RepID=A0A8N5EWA7_GEOFO|nr:F-BAR domain only protein 1 [Geospiza fortis]
MVKLSKMATNGTQLGTFAPLWEVFRISSDKLALCHLELMKKLHDLIKEISRYGEEQGRVHKKSKEEVAGTLEAVQLLHGVAQLLPKSKESYHSKCQEDERLGGGGRSTRCHPQRPPLSAELKSRKAGEALRRAVDKYNAARADFEQRMLDSAMRFQEVEEAHLRHMKGLIGSYSHSVEDTHVQIGQVHEEFKQNVENIGTEMLLRRFAESKGTGRERPGALDFDEYRLAPAQEGPKRSRSKAFRIPGLSRKERERDAVESPDNDLGCPEVDEDGFTVRPDSARSEVENPGCSSSDSDYDEDEPRKFYVHIKPVQPREAPGSAEAAAEQLKGTVGNLILAPGVGGTVRRQASRHTASLTPACGDTDPEGTLAAGDSTGRALPAAQVNRFGTARDWAPRSYVLTSSSSPFSSSSPENVEDSGLDSPSHPAPGMWNSGVQGCGIQGCRDAEFGGAGVRNSGVQGCGIRGCRGAHTHSQPALPRQSRSLSPSPSWSCGPSHSAPASLGERGFFTVTLLPLSPHAPSDPSQSDPSTKDFWLNMAALTGHLQKQAEQSPAAPSYTNLEEKRLLWKLLDIPGAPGQGGEAGPALLGAHGAGAPRPDPPNPCAYRMSLVKKRFATGIYLAGS